MRSVYIAIFSSMILLGCHGKSALEQEPHLASTLKDVNFEHEPGVMEQYRLGVFTIGGWVNQTQGAHFQLVKPQHDQAAVVYLYRPDSKWNRQEIVASSLFLNSERIPSLLNNHYYWVELPAGQYRLSSSRPLGINHFQKPKVLDFTVEAGQSYFIKYDEENLTTRRSVSGPLMLMPDNVGKNEIAFTEMKSASYNFVAENQDTGKARKSTQKIKRVKYDPASDVQLVKPFKLWNPLTW
ncbi:DUF2846 domain-containing protein [Acinetobacter sp. ANC 3813]|uniref:DUF2846 domain-containing protein n=1 Tax=Acinetobacter sp. ANC 3813 TaxID=1977873 RepID=UPI000A335968|nr:DUF2846 domain-containing protein [Acinetobacter sp. ANC 3813]OTG90006.1 hypothetical protein B9T34_09260 [Acinetobacter sp. ANC 3813]